MLKPERNDPPKPIKTVYVLDGKGGYTTLAAQFYDYDYFHKVQKALHEKAR